MPLTEEEKEFMSSWTSGGCPCDTDYVCAMHTVKAIIDRLLAENEEWKAENKLAVTVAAEFRRLSHIQEDDLQFVEAQLDAIKKAVRKVVIRVIDPQVGPDDNWILVPKEDLFELEALDRAIGGGK